MGDPARVIMCNAVIDEILCNNLVQQAVISPCPESFCSVINF